MSAAAKMVADSTQSDMTMEHHGNKDTADDKTHSSTKLKRRKNLESKKNKKAKKSGKKGTKKKNESPESEENNPDLDLDLVVKEIGEFMKDRQEMVTQMFHSVHGASMQRALPDVLKNIPLEELRQKCVEHLEVMSKKRILRIMAGDDPATISSSGTEDESSDEDVTNSNKTRKEQPQSQPADSTSQTGGCHSDIEDMNVQEDNTNMKSEETDKMNDDISSEGEREQWSPRSSRSGSEEGERISAERTARASVNPVMDDVITVTDDVQTDGELVESGVDDQEGQESEGEQEAVQEGVQVGEQEEEDRSSYEDSYSGEDNSRSVGGKSMSDTLIPALTKNQMELLELEMRAKAIKAMLSKMKK